MQRLSVVLRGAIRPAINAAISKQTVRCNSSSVLLQLREPNGPKITTNELPGPVSVKLRDELNQIQLSSGIVLFVDYEKSIGKQLNQ